MSTSLKRTCTENQVQPCPPYQSPSPPSVTRSHASLSAPFLSTCLSFRNPTTWIPFAQPIQKQVYYMYTRQCIFPAPSSFHSVSWRQQKFKRLLAAISTTSLRFWIWLQENIYLTISPLYWRHIHWANPQRNKAFLLPLSRPIANFTLLPWAINGSAYLVNPMGVFFCISYWSMEQSSFCWENLTGWSRKSRKLSDRIPLLTPPILTILTIEIPKRGQFGPYLLVCFSIFLRIPAEYSGNKLDIRRGFMFWRFDGWIIIWGWARLTLPNSYEEKND